VVPLQFDERPHLIGVFYVQLSKREKRRIIMRLLILATAATLVLTGTVMAAIPADTLSAHDMYMLNLRDSGYNPARDRGANGHLFEANMYQLKRVWRPKMNTH
jgi:hypothetical protein